jgi:hypothetical protein
MYIWRGGSVDHLTLSIFDRFALGGGGGGRRGESIK